MAHIVKCKVCGELFDRDKIACIHLGRRYVHVECAKEANLTGELIEPPQKDPDLVALEQCIMKLFNQTYVNPTIRKQINQYHDEYKFTYKGILQSLIYFFELKGNPIEKANDRISIVPYIYKEANQYYYNLYLAKIANEQKDISVYKPKVRYIEITPPKVEKKKIKLFNFDE